jgi:type I restriction enzyme S subunit
MSKFTTYKLEEIAEVQTGPFGSQLHMSDYKKEGTPIITVEHLGENRIIHKNLPLVSDEDKNRLKKYTLKEGDIVFSRVGSVDRCAYVSAKEDDWMFSGRCLRVRTNDKVDSRFLSFYFNQESFKEYIRMIAVGATMPSINTTILSEVEILLPPLNKQKEIAEILSSLDDKIDLLHRQNKTLEQLAETLFRQWFVEEAEESWEVKKISEIIEVRDGTHDSPKQKETGKYLITSKHLKPTGIDFESAYKISEQDFIEVNKRSKVDKDDILFSMIGTLGLIHFVTDEPNYAIKNIGLFKSSQKPEFAKFLYLLIKSPIGEKFIFESATGSTQEYITLGSLRNFEFNYPGENRILQFDLEVEPLFQKIKSNTQQIRTLTHLRDTLLPKLMSGEVRVNQINN